MSYTPTTWQTGDTITAEKMNNIESGISNAGSMVIPTFQIGEENQFTCDMTFAEVNSAIKSGKCVCAALGAFGDGNIYALSEYYEDNYAMFSCFTVGGGVFKDNITYSTDGISSGYEAYPSQDPQEPV